jgi:hypothetical protein
MKHTEHKPFLSEESIADLKFLTLDECEVRTNIIFHDDKPRHLGVWILLFANIHDWDSWHKITYDTRISYLNRVIDMIVNKVLEENPDLKLTHLSKGVWIREIGSYGADLYFKKKFFLKRLFSKKK